VSRWPADYRVELEAFWRTHHEAWRRSEWSQREYCEAHWAAVENASRTGGRSSNRSRRCRGSCCTGAVADLVI